MVGSIKGKIELTTSRRTSEDKTENIPVTIGQLERRLKSRHIQFIALGGTIGTGLFLGIGGALAKSGPLSLFLGYVFTSVAIWAMVSLFVKSDSAV